MLYLYQTEHRFKMELLPIDNLYWPHNQVTNLSSNNLYMVTNSTQITLFQVAIDLGEWLWECWIASKL